MKKATTINSENVLPMMQRAIKKLEEQEKMDRRLTVEAAKTLGWSDEAIDFGKANGMVK